MIVSPDTIKEIEKYWLTADLDKSTQIPGDQCGCGICALLRIIAPNRTFYVVKEVVSLFMIVVKLHNRLGQCDTDLLKKLI